MSRAAWLDGVIGLGGLAGTALGYLGGRRGRLAAVRQVEATTTGLGVETAAKATSVADKVLELADRRLSDMDARVAHLECYNDLLVRTLIEHRKRSETHEEWDREVAAKLRAAGIDVDDPPPLGDYLIPTDVALADLGDHPPTTEEP